jgi:hypothetical protein
MGVLTEFISLLVYLNIGPDSPHLLDPVEQDLINDRGVVVLRS